ncbi:ANTAR domain-containing protein [Arthrobacter sp. Cr_A7]|uniref:ANTAR domain-containing protein n=1 Tax=Arthrobacter sp. Cr_A7 TaxID=3031017 RepID=UPI0023DBA093|nr:ANTAR domain-containing protein [Arthrobacter sp. Cr_A7]MDF2050211.1 ANTAR domain-containing protein [Arthrobacter sp. Cr_A7]
MAKLQESRDGMSAAMQSRTVIDLATGAIMAQNRCSQAAAFQVLREASNSRNVKLRDVAATVVSSVAGGTDTFTYFDE